MLKKLLFLVVGLQILSSCEQSLPAPPVGLNSTLSDQIDARIINYIEAEEELFDWNLQSDEFFCEALSLVGNIIAVGIEGDLEGRQNLFEFIDLNQSEIELQDVNDKLGIFYLRTQNCNHLSAIRSMNGVRYIELDYYPADISKWSDSEGADGRFAINQNRTSADNPGTYVPGSEPYLDYLQGIDNSSVDRAYNHNMDEVYHEMGYFGSASTGVAVIDNGVHADRIDYLSVGPGGYVADGYFVRQWWDPQAQDDGPSPLPTDVFSFWQNIDAAYNHGTAMSEQVYSLSPFSHRKTFRTSPSYVLLVSGQWKAVANAITDMADDPQIKIVSMSMAGVFANNQVSSAIRYFNSKNKIVVAAAGSTFPILKDILGVLYPGRMPETVCITGIKDLDDTNGNMTLGFSSHGGPQNDFVIESSSSSSSATSTFAGMLATIWDINPDLDREELIDMMIEHSSFNVQQGSKHHKFGWGKVDMYQLALDVEDSL
ncbi:MAG: S8/S53 family peptidase [Bacteroidetes bacterium]|nr:S8/S53 family peptidase [Bacteroidota bacterium]